MKSKVLFLSSVLCACALPALSSDCTDVECDAADVKYEFTETVLDTTTGLEYIVDEVLTVEDKDSNPVPMRNVKLLTVKPAPIDGRTPLWDGTKGGPSITAYSKTVSWKNGVPIWDDSISNYKAKNFNDWMLKPLPEIYLSDGDTELITIYNETMNDAM